MQSKGIDAYPRRTDVITFSVTTQALDAHLGTIIEMLKQAEQFSRR